MRSELNIAAKSYARVMQAQGGAARHHRKWRRLPLGSLCAGRLITVRSVRPAGNRRPAKGARRDRRRIFWRNKVEQSGTVEMAEWSGPEEVDRLCLTLHLGVGQEFLFIS